MMTSSRRLRCLGSSVAGRGWRRMVVLAGTVVLLPGGAGAQLVPVVLHAGEKAPAVVMMGDAAPVAEDAAATASSAAPGAGDAAGMPRETSLSGNVTDATGALLPGAVVTLRTGTAGSYTAVSESDGTFRLGGLRAGPYTLEVAAEGATPWRGTGVLEEGHGVVLPEIALAVKPAEAFVQVQATRREVAEAQMQMEEKQRILGVFPNFYASYVWDAAPLSASQKYRMAWRFSADPVMFGMAAVVAGGEQTGNAFSGYGQGVAGFGKRFGAAYGDGLSSTMLGQAIFPALLHQDPRYFVKGTGTVRARTLYALAMTVMCRGDNGRWQVNYSNIAGNMTSAAISNAYYPSTDRHGATLTMENSLLTTASGALGNLLQEFMLRHMTPNVPDYAGLR